MSEWREFLLEDVIEQFIDYRGKTPQKTDSGVPLITAKVVKSGKILPPTEFIAVEDYEKWMRRGLPEVDDVVLTTEAPLGEVALITDKHVALAQRIITMRAKAGVAYGPFIKYYFQNETGQHELQSRASGTTVFGIKASVLRQVPIELPPIPEQRAIADVLSSLDDKIDLLHRQNKTLEAMAETLFRQWFVEEAGADWENVCIGDVIQTTSGGTPSRKKMEYFDDGTILWVKSKELNGEYVFDTEEKITKEGLFNSSAKLLPKNTILIAMYGATVGEYAILFSPAACNQAVCALLPNDNYPYTFLFMYAKLQKANLVNRAVGSAQQNISQALLKGLDIPSPSQRILEYHQIVEPLFDKFRQNGVQIRTLEALRDTLLPKLMSGEVRVSVT